MAQASLDCGAFASNILLRAPQLCLIQLLLREILLLLRYLARPP